ncbi:excalibur calcium-binding domain-containing protein [Streptomyces chartreusis]|uniref:excalibur calcium-binding domain-containing protein n=1 Tax=Streptomyces chartreusis TaxID=1969 RepID=UPI0036F8DBD0
MTNPYTTAPMPPQPPLRPAPKWARKRYVLPALALAFFIGIGAGGASGDDSKTTEAKPTSASPQPTVTVTTTAEAPEPEPAPTVTATKTVRVTRTVTATPALDTGTVADDDSSGADVYYGNCSEARAAGAAPVHRGEPGYASHLDRDNDGVGCDS